MGFSKRRVTWHSSGVHGPWVLEVPVGMLFISILGHFVFAVIGGGLEFEREGKRAMMPCWIIDFAAMIWSSELSAPPVRVMLPLMVHLAAAICTFKWLDQLRNLLTIEQMCSGLGRVVSLN